MKQNDLNETHIEDYVHRCGRTGRGGASGIAYTFFTPFDKNHSGELINVLKAANANVPNELLAFGTTVKVTSLDFSGKSAKFTHATLNRKKNTRCTARITRRLIRQ